MAQVLPQLERDRLNVEPLDNVWQIGRPVSNKSKLAV